MRGVSILFRFEITAMLLKIKKKERKGDYSTDPGWFVRWHKLVKPTTLIWGGLAITVISFTPLAFVSLNSDLLERPCHDPVIGGLNNNIVRGIYTSVAVSTLPFVILLVLVTRRISRHPNDGLHLSTEFRLTSLFIFVTSIFIGGPFAVTGDLKVILIGAMVLVPLVFGTNTVFPLVLSFKKLSGSLAKLAALDGVSTFEELLANPLAREALAKFLATEFSSENLMLWRHIGKFKKQLPRKRIANGDRATFVAQVGKVEAIMQQFVGNSAPFQVNLSAIMVEHVEQSLARLQTIVSQTGPQGERMAMAASNVDGAAPDLVLPDEDQDSSDGSVASDRTLRPSESGSSGAISKTSSGKGLADNFFGDDAGIEQAPQTSVAQLSRGQSNKSREFGAPGSGDSTANESERELDSLDITVMATSRRTTSEVDGNKGRLTPSAAMRGKAYHHPDWSRSSIGSDREGRGRVPSSLVAKIDLLFDGDDNDKADKIEVVDPSHRTDGTISGEGLYLLGMLFDDISRGVEQMMKQDSFRRFLACSFYQELCDKLNAFKQRGQVQHTTSSDSHSGSDTSLSLQTHSHLSAGGKTRKSRSKSKKKHVRSRTMSQTGVLGRPQLNAGPALFEQDGPSLFAPSARSRRAKAGNSNNMMH